MTGSQQAVEHPCSIDFQPFSLQLVVLVLLLGEVGIYILMALLATKYLIAAAKEGNRRQTAIVFGLGFVSMLVFLPYDESSDEQATLSAIMLAGIFGYLIVDSVYRKRIGEALAVVAVMVWLVIWLVRIGRRMAI
ncbi:hypothetical protein [Trichlorobacter sp.]|uniref:hypothetical protein n=1 Tax=Trichlorobacter sp. TaxID=2911007 RepID=UPI002A35B851|nr:hypothetical protein [Trichlorobacter sp.]MDY0385079.1 hypothetical protein [Trichlorobacter sp.]